MATTIALCPDPGGFAPPARRAPVSRIAKSFARRATAFTLIELLVCVAVIALLIAILLPGLSLARERGRVGKCLANLHGIAAAVNVYAADFDSHLPPFSGSTTDSAGVVWSQQWDLGYNLGLQQWKPDKGILSPYFPINGVPACPDTPPEMQGGTTLVTFAIANAPANIYQMNSLIATGAGKLRLIDITRPAGTAIFGETATLASPSSNTSNNGQGPAPTGLTLMSATYFAATSTAAAAATKEPNMFCLHSKQGGVAWADGHATMEKPWFSYSASLPMPANRATVYQQYNFGWFMPPPDGVDPTTATSAQITAWAQANDYFTVTR